MTLPPPGRRPPWRIAPRIALATVVAALALLASVPVASAAPVPGAVYEGTTSAGGTVRLVVNADGTLAVTVQHPGSGIGCAASTLTVATVVVAASGSQFSIEGAATTDGKATMAGFFSLPNNEVAVGAYVDEPSTASSTSCAPRAASWSASRVSPPVAPTAWPYATGVKYEGSSFTAAGVRIGTVQATSDAAGTLTVTLAAATGGCEYRTTQAVAFGARDRMAGPRVEYASGTGRIAAVTSATAIGGAFVIERVSPACPALAGMWVASAPDSGTFASPPNFGASFTALAVFTGGSAAQLEAAAKAAGASGIWMQDAQGRFVLLVVNGPAFINDPFRAIFANGIPGNTAVTLAR